MVAPIVAFLPDNSAMHILIPYACPPGPRCREAMATLQLPHLARLLHVLTPTVTLRGSPEQLTPLHERLQAQSLGLQGADGLLPWAALDAQRLGLTALHGVEGWAWITPCHWTIQAHHVDMADPQHLALTHTEAEALWTAMQPYFAEDGVTLFAQPLEHIGTRWLAHGAVFKDLPTASLERVTNHPVDPWMPRQEQAQPLRRLQNEMQMLLYRHPVNDTRAKFKLPGINSFWVSGTGTLSASFPAALISHAHSTAYAIRDALRVPALQDDAAAWALAWQSLDSTTLTQSLDLTLCGDVQAVTLARKPLSLWERLRQRMAMPTPYTFLSTL